MTKEVFNSLLRQLIKIKTKKDTPIRVAINGIEGTGKTTFATNFCKYLNVDGDKISIINN